MILHCPPFFRSDFSVVGDDLYISQSNGFIENIHTLSNILGHSVLTRGFSPSNARIVANYNFIFELSSSQVGQSSMIYEIINTTNNDIVYPADFIRLMVIATKENIGSINAYNPLAIDVMVVTKNFGIIYQHPRYYCNYAAFNEVGIIFELSNMINDQCDISIQYVDNHRWESFNYQMNSFNVSNNYQWHMYFNPELIAVYQQCSYLLMNVNTPLIAQSIPSQLALGAHVLTQQELKIVELPSKISSLIINNLLVSQYISDISLPSINSNLIISDIVLKMIIDYNPYGDKSTIPDLGDIFINSQFDLELTKDERDLKTDNTLITAILITLGTNISITQEEKILYGVDTRSGWYAETIFDYAIGWKGWLIPHLKTNETGIIKKWLLEAFQWLKTDKIIQNLEVIVQKIDTENYYFQLQFYKKNDHEDYKFVYNWEKKNLERR